MQEIPRYRVGNINFSVLTLANACAQVAQRASALLETRSASSTGVAVHFCNAFHIALSQKDAHLSDMINSADFVFTDGTPVTWVGHVAAPHLKTQWQRVYGPDFMRAIWMSSTQESPSHYLLGATPETLAKLQTNLEHNFPQARIAGVESPPFREATASELAERDQRILESGATYVWVGLGTPKQDWEANRLAAHLPVVAVAIGAAFDFLAGTKAQAPVWIQKSGFEWAFRLASEPKRLGKRYLWGNSVFVVESVKTLAKSKNSRHRK